MTPQSEQTEQISSPNPIKKYIITGLLIALIILIGLLTWLYVGANHNTQRTVFSKLPLPIAFVQTKAIFGNEFYKRLDLADQILSQNNIPQNDLNQTVLAQLIDNRKLEVLADKHKVTVSDGEIQASFAKILKNYGTDNEQIIAEELKTSYGISLEEFKDEVLKHTLLQDQLALWHNNQEQLNPEAYGKARELLSKLDGGQAFEEVARQYTEDEATREFAGDSGFIAYQDMLPEFQTAVKDISLNEPKLIASRAGLHIISVTAIQEGDNPDNKNYQIQQIYIEPDDLSNWLNSELDQISSVVLI